MENMRINTFKFSSHIEEQLSVFGRKVLQELIKSWNKEEELKASIYRRRGCSENVFRGGFNDELHGPAPRSRVPKIDYVNVDRSPEFECAGSSPARREPPPPPPVIEGLPTAKPTRTTAAYKPVNILKNDFKPVVIIPPCDDNKHEDFGDARDVIVAASEKVQESDTNNGNDKDVDWDNMFDSELFPSDAPAATVPAAKVDTVFNAQRFNINFPLSKADKAQRGNTNKKSKKRANQTKITDAIPKKVKKSESDQSSKTKNNYRKQKYTKTIKNWLDDVTPHEPVEKVPVTPAADEGANDNAANSNIIIEKNSKREPKKKTVQAQLANRDGVMKFRKPVQGTNNEVCVSDEPTEKPTAEASNAKGTRLQSKVKKAKSKFVVPIKSQSLPPEPVYHYEIHTLDDLTFVRYEKELLDVKDCDVTMILLYSNGFCQAAAGATATTGDALALLIWGRHYALQGRQMIYRNMLLELLNNNNIICFDGKDLLIYIYETFAVDLEDLKLDMKVIDVKIGSKLLEAASGPEWAASTATAIDVAGGAIGPLVQDPIGCVGSPGTPGGAMGAAAACERVAATAATLRSAILATGLQTVFYEIEMPIVAIVAAMQHRGVSVDSGLISRLSTAASTRLSAAEAGAAALGAASAAAAASPAQLSKQLFGELQLHRRVGVPLRGTKVTGRPSTGEDMLSAVMGAHPLPALVRSRRRAAAAKIALLALETHAKDGIVRPVWEQVAAVTGRMTSRAPNLQALPSRADRTTGRTDGSAIRACIVSRAGCVLVAGDYRQAECRVLARAARCGRLAAALNHTDLFAAVAADWYGKPVSEISTVERGRAKQLAYAAAYGAGAAAAARALHLPMGQAKEMLDSFNARFPALKRWREGVGSTAAQAPVRTPAGRARRFPEANNPDSALRARAQRQAANFVIQGCLADICKRAMHQCRVVWAEAVGSAGSVGSPRLLLQLHDELVWEVPRESLHQAAAILSSCMESAGAALGAGRLPVALRAGASWGHLAEYRPPGPGPAPALAPGPAPAPPPPPPGPDSGDHGARITPVIVVEDTSAPVRATVSTDSDELGVCPLPPFAQHQHEDYIDPNDFMDLDAFEDDLLEGPTDPDQELGTTGQASGSSDDVPTTNMLVTATIHIQK